MAEVTGEQLNRLGDEVQLKDNEATASIYTTKPVKIRIGSNQAEHYILHAHVDQYSGLKARYKTKSGLSIDLPEVDEDIAHTFTHFIWTSEYQTIGLGGIPENVRAVAEFKRSVLAYIAGRTYEMDVLIELTQAKMDYFSKQISIFKLQEVVVEVHERLPHNEFWFPDHLYRWVKDSLIANDNLVTDEQLLESVGKSTLFAKAVVKSIGQMYKEKAAFLDHLAPTENSQSESAGEVDASAPALDAQAQVSGEEPEDDATPSAGSPIISDKNPDEETVGVDQEDVQLMPSSIIVPVHVDLEVSSAKTADEPARADSVVTEVDSETTSAPTTIEDKDIENAKVGETGKATDSEVEAARAKDKKKSKKKKNKRAASDAHHQLSTP